MLLITASGQTLFNLRRAHLPEHTQVSPGGALLIGAGVVAANRC